MKANVYAKVVEDSLSPEGVRLTTMEVNLHRFVLAEFNTARVFSRNSASSRAIPFSKQVQRLYDDPAIPVAWPAEQRGMQGGEELLPREQRACEATWLRARDQAVANAKHLHLLGLHKSVVNRILEPYLMHKIIVSSTEWDNFWEQRCSPLAQPEIRAAAEAMRAAYDASTPFQFDYGAWHLPYYDRSWNGDDENAGADYLDETYPDRDWSTEDSRKIVRGMLKAVSSARCARVSYLTHDGKRDIAKDIELYERLVSARPGHWSPLEHVATPAKPGEVVKGNLVGWHQHRHEVGT
ncbi:MAG: FAD-dependent thymidylate synthase [Actinobacteria bacterium]|nr:FAD-dependent thymidylate synthase [Actinomycetota bacterium]